MRGTVVSFYDTNDDRLARADGLRDPERSYRLVTPEDLKERRRVVSSIFYGFSALQLSMWCLVDEATAMRWKRGEEDPSPQALQLFKLHRDGRVLGPEWRGWRVVAAQLIDPENQSTTQGQLRAYFVNYQLLHKLMRKLDIVDEQEARAEYLRAMELAG
jgi:hypothetical protein